MVSNDFKNAIQGIRYLHGKITVGENVYDDKDNVFIKPRFNAELFKTIMPVVDFETEVEIEPRQWVNIQIGVMIDEDTREFEYVDFGEYYINEEPTYNMDTMSWTYKGYNKMIEAMIPYYELDIEYPITFENYLIAICEHLGWEYDLDYSFPNKNSLINKDHYKDLGLTLRDVLDDVCPMSMGNFANDGTFKILYPNDTNEVIDENWLNEDNTELFETIKPINSLVLSRAEGGDKLFRQDIEEDEEVSEIEIKDSIILSSEDREDYIDEMFNYIKGFTYTPFEIETRGTMWFKPLDKFIIQKEGVDYETILLNYEINYEDGLFETMFSPQLEQAVSDYKTSAMTDKAKKMANIIAHKTDAKIELLTQSLDDNVDRTSSLILEVDSISTEVKKIDDLNERVNVVEQTASDITARIEKIGGQNLIVNSVGLYNQDDWENPHDVVLETNPNYNDLYNNSVSKSGWMFMENRIHKQVIDVPQGTYTMSAKYKKLLAPATIHFIVNGLPYEVAETDWTEIEYTFTTSSNSIEISFVTDSDNSLIMTDLMLNGEEIALTWQPANGESILGIVRMSSAGVDVGSKSGSNVNLGKDGLRMYYQNTEVGRTIASGIFAREIQADKGDIAGTLIIEKDNQTWLSRR